MNSLYSKSLHCTNGPSHVILWWKWLTAWENGVKDVRSCGGYKFLVWMSDNSLVSERRSQHPSWCQSFIPQYLHQSPQYLNISPPIFTWFVVYMYVTRRKNFIQLIRLNLSKFCPYTYLPGKEEGMHSKWLLFRVNKVEMDDR